MNQARTARPGRIAALVMLVLGPLIWLMIGHRAPIAQDRGYHLFADTRSCLGVGNFANIASNLLFLLVGAAGVLGCWGRRGGAWRSWLVFFAGVALVFFGSAHYHGNPNDDTLVWDRLPMTVAFMALFAALVSEHLEAGLEIPLLAIPYVVAAFPGHHTLRHYLLYGVALYVLAKAAELFDHQIYASTAGMISGHSLKHLLAAAAVFCVLLMLRRRQSLTPVASSQ